MKTALGVFLIFILSACSNSAEDIEKVKMKAEANVESAKDVDILYSDSAVVRMRIKSPLMQNRQDKDDPTRVFPNGIWVNFFDVTKSPTSHLTAKYAEYSEKNKLITLRESIVVNNYKNEKLETEELFWSERDGRIYSKKFVRVTTPSEIIHGYGFSSNMEFTEWEIDSVSGVFQSGSLIEK
jgi:LPS export ABC transporter protein LptC